MSDLEKSLKPKKSRKSAKVQPEAKPSGTPLRHYSEAKLSEDIARLEKQAIKLKLSIDNHEEELVEKKNSQEKLNETLSKLRSYRQQVANIHV